MYNTKEIWMPVVGYEGLYLASNLGRIRSLDRYFTRKDGVKSMSKGKILSKAINKNGYEVVNLAKDSVHTSYYVHSLVYYSFHPAKKDLGLDINHKDGVKTNNNIFNLEAITRSKNLKHSYENNLHKRNEKHPMAKLNNANVTKIKQLFSDYTDTELADRFGVCRQTINNIRRGVIWKNI